MRRVCNPSVKSGNDALLLLKEEGKQEDCGLPQIPATRKMCDSPCFECKGHPLMESVGNCPHRPRLVAFLPFSSHQLGHHGTELPTSTPAETGIHGEEAHRISHRLDV